MLEKRTSRKLLTQFNSLYREMDDIYHSIARHYGLSDCAFWIFYIIRETSTCYTQSQLCEMLSLSKQTINSALKSLEAADYIRLEAVAGSRKSKQIRLTQRGSRFAGQSIDQVLQMELQAFDRFSAEEQGMFSRLLATYVGHLEQGARALRKASTGEGSYEHHNN